VCIAITRKAFSALSALESLSTLAMLRFLFNYASAIYKEV